MHDLLIELGLILHFSLCFHNGLSDVRLTEGSILNLLTFDYCFMWSGPSRPILRFSFAPSSDHNWTLYIFHHSFVIVFYRDVSLHFKWDRRPYRPTRTELPSRKHAYIILTPLNPTSVINWGLQGYIFFFLFLLKNIDCGYSLEPPHRGGSNEYHNICFEQKYEKIIRDFLSEKFQFSEEKFSIYLNRPVFVMC